MKQLLIVKTGTALNGGKASPKDLSGMTNGSIGFFSLGDSAAWLAAAPTENFGIALGRGADGVPFVIPEVAVDNLKTVKSAYAAGANYTGSIVIPSGSGGKNYTLVLVKLGTGINGERNKWTQSVHVPTGGSMTANDIAKKLRDGFQAMTDAGSIDVTVGGTGGTVIITGKSTEDGWKLVPSDDLAGTSVTETAAYKTVGDKKYVEDLARACAGNKGFLYTDLESQHVYPGYPEDVEDVHYTVYSLHFATGRLAGKQVDEKIFQYVHIAIPETLTSVISSVDTILGLSAPAQSGGGAGGNG